MFRVLKTDGGPHPADKWAVFTSEDVFDVSKMNDEAGSKRLMEAKRVQLAIADALTKVHAEVQDTEKGMITSDVAEKHLAKDVDASAHIEAGLAAVLSAVKGSSWEQHYARPDVQDEVRKVLDHHFATAQDMVRQWHADENPDHKAAQAYKARLQASKQGA